MLVAEVGEDRRVVRDPERRGRARARATSSRARPPRRPPRPSPRSVAWSSGAPGVVTWASWRSRVVADLRLDRPDQARSDTPAASSAATARNEVVVLPSVPVIPTTPSSSRRVAVPPAGRVGEGGPGRGHDELRAAASRARPARRSPRRRRPRPRRATYSCAVDVEPRDRDEQRPLLDLARVLGDAPDGTSPDAADADRQVVAPCAAQEAGGVEPGEQPAERPRLGAARPRRWPPERRVARSSSGRSSRGPPGRHEARHARQPAADARSATAGRRAPARPASATHSAPNDRLCSYRPYVGSPSARDPAGAGRRRPRRGPSPSGPRRGRAGSRASGAGASRPGGHGAARRGRREWAVDRRRPWRYSTSPPSTSPSGAPSRASR